MLELKNITELKNSIKGFNIRQKQAEERINELKDRLFEIIQSEGGKGKKRKKKHEESLRDDEKISSRPIHVLWVYQKKN